MTDYPVLPAYGVAAAPPVAPEEVAEEEPFAIEQKLPKRKRFLRRCSRIANKVTASIRNFRHRFEKLEAEPELAIPPENPHDTEAPRLVKMIESKEPPLTLLAHGFSIQAMEEQDIKLQDLRNAKYTMQDLSRLFESWTNLQSAGFTKYHMDSELWSLDLLASLFRSDGQYADLNGSNALQLAREMNFTLDDYLRTLSSTTALAAIMSAEMLLQHKPTFRHIFKMHLTPECFKIEFGATKEHFLQLRDNVTPEQFQALVSTCNWNMFNLRRVFDIERTETPLKIVVG